MAKPDQIISLMWQKLDIISLKNFEALLKEIVTTKTVPTANKIIFDLKIPISEQIVVSDIIHALNESMKFPKKNHLFSALQQLQTDLETIKENIASIKKYEISESSSDQPPALLKDNITHLKLNKIQKDCVSILYKSYHSKKMSSFKLAKYLNLILITQQKSLFQDHFKKYANYAQFCDEVLRSESSSIALEKIHIAFEHQDDQKPVSYMDYITQIYNTLTEHEQKRHFINAKWYMAVWTLVTFLKKHEVTYNTNPTIKKLCNEYGLNNVAFDDFYDNLSSLFTHNNSLYTDLRTTCRAYFAEASKIADERSDDNLSEKEKPSHVTKRKKRPSNEGVKQPFKENPDFEDRIKKASEPHIPKTTYFDYSFYSKSTEISDGTGKKYKVLTHKLVIPPRKELSPEAAYQEGLAIQQYLIDKFHLKAKSLTNVLVQPVEQDEVWQEKNSYELRHQKQDIRFDCTIDPRSPVGTVVVRASTILTIVTHYYPSSTTDAKETNKSPANTPIKKNKLDKTQARQYKSLIALVNASSAQTNNSENQEESTGEHTPRSPSAFFYKPAAGAARTPTPYKVTYPETPTPAAAQKPESKPSSVLAPANVPSPEQSHTPKETEIIDISDDDEETKDLKQKLAEAQQLLNKQQQELALAKNETAKQKSEFLADKKRRQRESLDKLTADLAANQQALAAEQKLQERFKKMRESKEQQQATESSITSSSIR